MVLHQTHPMVCTIVWPTFSQTSTIYGPNLLVFQNSKRDWLSHVTHRRGKAYMVCGVVVACGGLEDGVEVEVVEFEVFAGAVGHLFVETDCLTQVSGNH